MKLTYQDLVVEYQGLFNKQPEEVKNIKKTCDDIMEDASIQEVLSFINRQDTMYCTYSHN